MLRFVVGCGRYKRGKHLGEGQYGTVWEAIDIKTGLTYAAKVAASGSGGVQAHEAGSSLRLVERKPALL